MNWAASGTEKKKVVHEPILQFCTFCWGTGSQTVGQGGAWTGCAPAQGWLFNRQTENYRPVVLLDVLFQLVSYIIQEWLVRIAEGSNILEPGQGGFRVRRGCDINMHKLDFITRETHKKSSNVFVRIDVDFENDFNNVTCRSTMMPRNRILRNCYTQQVWMVCSLTDPDFTSLMVRPIPFVRTWQKQRWSLSYTVTEDNDKWKLVCKWCPGTGYWEIVTHNRCGWSAP